jgi:hypothetical protein
MLRGIANGRQHRIAAHSLFNFAIQYVFLLIFGESGQIDFPRSKNLLERLLNILVGVFRHILNGQLLAGCLQLYHRDLCVYGKQGGRGIDGNQKAMAVIGGAEFVLFLKQAELGVIGIPYTG